MFSFTSKFKVWKVNSQKQLELQNSKKYFSIEVHVQKNFKYKIIWIWGSKIFETIFLNCTFGS